MSQQIVIIDYGMGNLRSVHKKFEILGANVCITADLSKISQANKLVLPGVGHFGKGVKNLKELGIWSVLNHKVLIKKTPILGICLGMQLMAKHSEEGNVSGLGWFDADVVRFDISNRLTHKVPHMGWNTVNINKPSKLLEGVSANTMYYFVHSYHMVCYKPEDASLTTTYEYSFVSAIEKDHIFGTQFHPEKSHDWGEKLIQNFINL